MNIGRFSVSNSVLINILMITILILGAFSISRLPQEQFSEVPFFWANIIVPYPGVSAEDVEKTVTVKIETELKGLDKVKEINSVSQEGLSIVRVQFDEGITNDEFARSFKETQTQFNKVNLPDGTLPALIDEFSSADFLPVIEVILSGDVPFKTLNANAKLLQEKLLQIPQVSKVDLIGARDRQIIVDASKEKLESLGISLDEVVRAVQQRNITVPGGTLETRSREYLLRTVGEVAQASEFGTIIVRRSPGQNLGTVHLGDIADIKEGFDPEGGLARFNEKRSISLRIAKVARGSSTGVIDSVKTQVSVFEQTIPAGMEISLFNDSTVQIRDSFSILITNSLMGFALLIIILLLFIGFRNALITAIGIPITFALTFLVLELLGETLNSNTLFGLVLVLGLIVDHAIVIVENSYRLQQGGLSRIDSAIQGTNEVVKPVIAATLTTVAAFLPLMILPGTIGKFLRVIPLTVSIALLASTAEALVILPVHFAEWSGKLKAKRRDLFAGFRRGYERFLKPIYRHRYIAFGVVFVVLIASFGLVGLIQQDLFSAEDFTVFYIDIELPAGATLTRTDTLVRSFERRIVPLIGNGEITAVNSSIGFSSEDTGASGNNVAQIVVDILERNERRGGEIRSIVEIMQEVQTLTADIAGAESVRFRKAANGPPQDPPVSFRILGDNYEEMIAISNEVKQQLATYPELYNIRDNLEAGSPELRIRVNQDRAAQYGLSAAAVGLFIRGSFDGITASTLFRENEEVDVVVRYAGREAHTVQQLSQYLIPTRDGRLIPFSSVASIEEGQAIASIKRVDGKREVTITAEAFDEGNVRSINAQIRILFEQRFRPFYPGIVFKVGGEFAEFNTLLIQILRIFLIGVFLIYIILGTQFKSYLQPVLILFAIPFAFVGVILFLFVSGTPFSTTVLYAGVALAGIAVNDSIVLISFINDLKKQGRSTAEAVIESASTRLRPILLTSLTTIAGLTPIALGLGGKSLIWGPMASTIIFGLLFSTITALIIIPCMYGILDDIRSRLSRKHGSMEKLKSEL